LVYLLVLSRVGEQLDKRGMHRIHAACLAYKNRAVLLVLPSGGGKTTLTLKALQNNGIYFLSDDSPLVTLKGDLLAFPLRIGCGNKPDFVAEEHLCLFKRREHGEKWLIDTEIFQDKILPRVKPGIVIIGLRKLSGRSSLRAMNKFAAIGDLVRSMVIGIGLAQLIEYVFSLRFSSLLKIFFIASSRLWASVALLFRSRVYQFEIGPDIGETHEVLLNFLVSLGSDDL
jgi:hypothetical protein